MIQATRLAVLGIAALLATPTQTMAVAAESRVPSWVQSHLAEGDVATRAVYTMAVCIRDKRLAQAEAMLRTVPGTPEERAAMPTVRPPAIDECLYRTSKLRIRNMNILRGALAEAIYNGRKTRPRSDRPLPLDLKTQIPADAAARLDVASPRMVAACAVQQRPAQTHQVLQFNPGSLGERKALQALNPMFELCLPTGANLSASPLAIRAALAEALYFGWRARADLFQSK